MKAYDFSYNAAYLQQADLQSSIVPGYFCTTCLFMIGAQCLSHYIEILLNEQHYALI